MRKAILGAVSALALASPAVAADLPVTPQVPSYERHTYEYPTAPPVVVEEPAPVVVRRPVIVAPPVVVEEYPVYAAPRPVYATAPMYAFARPVWQHGWGHRGHFHGRW
jgi:opacity protein-like surface antigen